MTPLPHLPSTRASLIARLNNAADTAGWEEFVSVYGGLVYGEVCRRGFSKADAEDLTQQIFLRVFRGLSTYDYNPRRGRFRDWLGTIVRHEILRGYRERLNRPAAAASDSLDDNAAPTAEPEWVDAFQTHMLAVASERCRPRFKPVARSDPPERLPWPPVPDVL